MLRNFLKEYTFVFFVQEEFPKNKKFSVNFHKSGNFPEKSHLRGWEVLLLKHASHGPIVESLLITQTSFPCP